jgi:hypothetical protein
MDIQCFNCKTNDMIDLYKVDDKYYCEDCANNAFQICTYCEEYIGKTETTHITTTGIVCDSCFFNYYTKCVCCNRYERYNLSTMADGLTYCEECARRDLIKCLDCDSYHKKADMYYTYYDYYVCERCYQQRYFTCAECGNIYHFYNVNNTVDTLCQKCYQQKYYIAPYDYSPDKIIFYSNNESRKDNLHIGIELEIQGEEYNSLANFVKTIKSNYSNNDMFYLKEDGSLNSYGVEIVSHPMTYKYIMTQLEWFNVFSFMKQHNMNDTDDCGLHFHLDKKYLTNDNIKVIDFIVNNFSLCFHNICGREYNQLSRYCKTTYKDINDWGLNTTDRYVAVNLENEETVELRFCKSTADYDTFIERLKMICAIVQFAKKYKIQNIYNYTKDNFISAFNNVYKELFGMFLFV